MIPVLMVCFDWASVCIQTLTTRHISIWHHINSISAISITTHSHVLNWLETKPFSHPQLMLYSIIRHPANRIKNITKTKQMTLPLREKSKWCSLFRDVPSQTLLIHKLHFLGSIEVKIFLPIFLRDDKIRYYTPAGYIHMSMMMGISWLMQ